jgi:ABC-type nickel/cobalt efflux system permease component RcnA
MILLGPGKFIIFIFMLEDQLKLSRNFSFSLVTPLVNMSAGFWLVCIFSNFKCPSSKMDHMKWYLICICLVFEWKVEFFAI